jgi:phage FluMu protein Com
VKRAKKRPETQREALSLSNAGCPRCKAIRPIRILLAGRDVAATEGWVEVRCIRCKTEWRIVPIHPDEEALCRQEAREQAERGLRERTLVMA